MSSLCAAESAVFYCPLMSLRAQRGNPVAVATEVRRRVFNPHRGCHVPRRARDERALLAMSDGVQRLMRNHLCHCERSAAIPSPQQRRCADVCSISSRLPRRCAPRNDRLTQVRVRWHDGLTSIAMRYSMYLRRWGGRDTPPVRTRRANSLSALEVRSGFVSYDKP